MVGMRIAVLGAGSWGTTVASLLAGHNDCTVWARDPELAREIYERDANSRYLPGFALPANLKATADLEKAVHDADLLVVGVPTHGFRAILVDIRPYLRPWIPVVSLAKGFERGSLLRMTQIIREELPGHPPAALTGPNLAKEIMAGQAAASVIATEDLAVARALQSVMQRGVFRIYINHDVIGCEVGGALKNVVAIATGIAQGLGVGDNTRAAVVSRGLPGHDLLGQVGPGQGGGGMTGQLVPDDLGHPQQRAALEALGQADHRDPGPQVRAGVDEDGPEPVGGHADDQQVDVVHGFLQVSGGLQGRREREPGQVARVSVAFADLPGQLGVPGPDGTIVPARQQRRHGRAPRSGAQHRDAHLQCHPPLLIAWRTLDARPVRYKRPDP